MIPHSLSKGLLILQIIFPASGAAMATFELEMARFQNPSGTKGNGDCCDVFCSGACENQFTFCLDIVRTPINTDIGLCSFGLFATGEFLEGNNVNFEKDMVGVANPITTQIFSEVAIVLKVKIMDIDLEIHDVLDTMHQELSVLSLGRTQSGANWTQATLTGLRNTLPTRLELRFRAYCGTGYYGPSCDVHCVAQDSDTGHYTCDQDTGEKICMEGWINPSLSCVTLDDPCPLTTCRYGGTCSGNNGTFSCTCIPEYTGVLCETATVCVGEPCQNGATCSLSSGGFKCSCLPYFTGSQCETEIQDPCDSQPCRNGVCSRTPESYVCTCTEGYTGPNCEMAVENPCDELPCLNSGVCSTSPDGHTCTCTEGYTGDRCQDELPCRTQCYNGGSCLVTGGGCLCPACYTGPQCATHVCSAANCSGLESCSFGSCNCNGIEAATEPAVPVMWIGLGATVGVLVVIAAVVAPIVWLRVRKRRRLPGNVSQEDGDEVYHELDYGTMWSDSEFSTYAHNYENTADDDNCNRIISDSRLSALEGSDQPNPADNSYVSRIGTNQSGDGSFGPLNSRPSGNATNPKEPYGSVVNRNAAVSRNSPSSGNTVPKNIYGSAVHRNAPVSVSSRSSRNATVPKEIYGV